ncbi:uroporphyrinogen decarboxylase family protein [Bacteroidota bacterium]
MNPKKLTPLVFIMFFLLSIISNNLFCQSNKAIKYQSIIRDSKGKVIENQNVSIKINIIQNSPSGLTVYSEKHDVISNQFGLINIEIGNGDVLSGNYLNINWGGADHFAQIEIDENNGRNYHVMGVSQLMYVPYALHAETVSNKDDADADPGNEIQILSISNDTILLSNGGYAKLPAGFSGSFNDLIDVPVNLDTDATNDFNGDYNDLINQPSIPSNVSELTNDAGYLMDEVDGSVTNEIQVLSISNDTILLSNGGFELYEFGDLFEDEELNWEKKIVFSNEERIITQDFCEETGKWSEFVTVHTKDNPPATDVLPEYVGLNPTPDKWEDIANVKEWPKGMELWKMIKKEMGDYGIVGMPSGVETLILKRPENIYEFYENPIKYFEIRDKMIEKMEARMKIISTLDEKPDFLFCGASGSLVFQSPDIFRELVLPALKKVTKLAADIGIPTHVHSCGPETELVKIAAEETYLTIIDPLEIPPMGDCNLAELKKLYGDKIILKGNLHTTKVMLNGSKEDVIEASKKAIDDAASGGGFVLSTGDQCGRDTLDENIFAMVETARSYGKY